MIVKELIEQLSQYPQDAEVWLDDECCGCSNLADDVMLVDDDPKADYVPYAVITG